MAGCGGGGGVGALAGWSAEFGGFWSDGSVAQILID